MSKEELLKKIDELFELLEENGYSNADVDEAFMILDKVVR